MGPSQATKAGCDSKQDKCHQVSYKRHGEEKRKVFLVFISAFRDSKSFRMQSNNKVFIVHCGKGRECNQPAAHSIVAFNSCY